MDLQRIAHILDFQRIAHILELKTIIKLSHNHVYITSGDAPLINIFPRAMHARSGVKLSGMCIHIIICERSEQTYDVVYGNPNTYICTCTLKHAHCEKH